MNQISTWLDRHNVGLTTLLVTAALLIGAALVVLLLNRLLNAWLSEVEPRLGWRYGSARLLARVITGMLWIITALLLLDIWGIGVGGVWTLLVSAATVVGVGFLATWTMISNITASVFLAVWRPFRLGDSVEILPENLKGRAIDRNLMFTTLREESGTVLQIPNNLFFQKIFRVASGG
jgi:small-conductance mechanosensitive channel